MSFPGYQTANKEELGIDWLYFFVVVRHAIKSCPSFFVDGTYQQPSPAPSFLVYISSCSESTLILELHFQFHCTGFALDRKAVYS